MSEQSQRKGRLPILIAAVGVGVILIASGTVTFVSQERAVQAAVASTETALAPTLTSTMTVAPSETPTITLTPTDTPTGTLLPTFTPTVTFTPSPTPIPPSVARPSAGSYATPVEEQPTAIPTPVQPVAVPDGVVNIMLLGSDRREGDGGYRTDTILIVSINRTSGTVNMLSLPRDLYVYIPGWKMERINAAAARGSSVGWPGGGAGLLKETLLYNFGITVHYFARVEFDNFKDIVDILGGIEVPVDCTVQSFVLKAPRKERSDFSSYEDWEAYTAEDSGNWEPYTLPVGVHQLDGYMALWYARLRHGIEPGQSYTDYDRARRQQKVLRAIVNKGRSLGLVTRVPELWTKYSDLIETDMGLGNMLQLAPIAGAMDSSKINSYILTSDRLIGWKRPTDGADVLLPSPGAVEQLVLLAMQPPSEGYLVANTAKVEIRNGTGRERIDEVAADLLISEKGGGMFIVPTGVTDRQSQTVIYDFTGRDKGGQRQLAILKLLLGVKNDQVIVQADPSRAFDYVVVLGADYLNRTCTYNVPAPVTPTTPTPVTTPTP